MADDGILVLMGEIFKEGKPTGQVAIYVDGDMDLTSFYDPATIASHIVDYTNRHSGLISIKVRDGNEIEGIGNLPERPTHRQKREESTINLKLSGMAFLPPELVNQETMDYLLNRLKK